jgi:acetolactate decarboxylase
MPKHVIDDRFIGSLHLMGLTRNGLAHDPDTERTVVQTSTINALLEGCYEGDVTLGELLQHATDGIGTVQGLDGELIVLRGHAYTARADGSVEALDQATKTPFAVLTKFDARPHVSLSKLGFRSFLNQLDNTDTDAPVLAVRATGTFENLHLRSIAKQNPPYRPLPEVVADQTEWHLEQETGDVIGFRFPDSVAGVEVPGWHLHFLSATKDHGGHVISLDVVDADIEVSPCDELHIELPSGVPLGKTGDADKDAINAVEAR